MKSLLRWLFDKHSSDQSPPEAPVVQPVIVEPPAEAEPPKATEPTSGPDPVDAKVKLQSARCDLHPLYPMLPATEEVIFPSSAQAPKMKVLRCTKNRCDRHYTTEFGYFRFVAGQPSEMGENKTTPECHLEHEPRFMLVARIDGEFLWACPADGCSNTVPYVEVAET